MPLPAGFRFQPIAADEVATRMVEIAHGGPQGLVPDMGGPRVSDMADLVRAYLRATNRHRAIVRVPTMGGAARAIRAGANLIPDRAVGIQTWEEFLAERISPTRHVVGRTRLRRTFGGPRLTVPIRRLGPNPHPSR